MSEQRKTQTTKITGGAEYAKVADRLLLFRADWPKSKIETLSRSEEDGSTIFKAWIWRDKADYIDVLKSTQNAEVARSSADADGEAKGKVGQKDKDYEKLQSIAVGRALAMVGYAASGEIASFEEMTAFNEYRDEERKNVIARHVEALSKAETIEELKGIFVATGMMQEPLIVAAKDARKKALSEEASGE